MLDENKTTVLVNEFFPPFLSSRVIFLAPKLILFCLKTHCFNIINSIAQILLARTLHGLHMLDSLFSHVIYLSSVHDSFEYRGSIISLNRCALYVSYGIPLKI